MSHIQVSLVLATSQWIPMFYTVFFQGEYFYPGIEKISSNKMGHPVDGSDIPNNHLGCFWNLVNHGDKLPFPQLVFSRRISEPSAGHLPI